MFTGTLFKTVRNQELPRNCDIFTQWNIIQPLKKSDIIKFSGRMDAARKEKKNPE